MSASVSWVDFAICRRCSPTRRVRSTKSGISAKAKSASSQLRRIIPTIVASTVVTLETIDVAVFVTTPWTPPMSLEMRDCTSPVRVRVKNASDSRCRCRKTAARRSCITRCPTWFDSRVCQTPSTPFTIAIAIIPAANTEISLEFLSPIACRRSRSRKAGTTPSAAEIRISASTTASRRRYGRNSRAIRFRFARRTAGSSGRSGGS